MSMFRRRRSREDFAAEIQAHLELEADELKREGLGAEEAWRRAHVEFGSVRATQERFYLRGRVAWLDTLARDLKFTLRQLVRSPGFALTAMVVLALGMGASLAIFAFVDTALLEPLPYAAPSRIMSVNESGYGHPRWPLSYPDYLDWQRLNKSFSSLAIYGGAGFALRTGQGAEPVGGARVSGGFFQTLGVRPILGRDFAPGENRPGGPNVAILSYGAWLHRFGGRRQIVGQTVDLDSHAYTVIGVLPRTFTFARAGNAEFWVPINSLSAHEQQRTFYNFWGIGRLRDGETAQSAQAEMQAIAINLHAQFPSPMSAVGASVIPLSEVVVGDVRPILLMLLGGAGLLWLIACVNVASLVLVRSESRRREIAVRGALGATPFRLVRQFVTEGLLLAALGSAAGLLVATALIRLLARMVPKDMAANMPFLEGAGPNAHTAAFAAVVALLAALLLAATPALRLGFQNVRDGLADGDRGAASRLWRKVGANLVVVELAVAVVLLAGAGLLGKSLYRLLHVQIGFNPDHLVTTEVMIPGAVYSTDAQLLGLYREIEQRVSALPGVQAVGATSLLPVQCDCALDRIQFPGRPDDGKHIDVDERHATAGYLPALNAKLLRGRFFTSDDDSSRPSVAVINETLARMYFPGQDPIGQKIADDEGGKPTIWEIVGVVADVREGPLDGALAPAEYFPVGQTHDHSFNLVVRTSQDPAAILPSLVSLLHGIDHNLGISEETTMNQMIGNTQSALLHRFAAWLVGGFAAIALVLGVVGLYGVIAYSVSLRTREIGVRMALGAKRDAVYRLVMRQAGWLTIAGLAIGLACSVGTSLLIRKLLFGVQAWDAMTLGGVAVLLGLASTAASFLPARRAASVNPVEALRAE
jgi:macrolide transport system ATP-binding/permease protein